MNVLTLDVEVQAGTSINEACEQAKEMAVRLGCNIRFSFNGIECYMKPKGDPRKLAEEFSDSIDQGKELAFS